MQIDPNIKIPVGMALLVTGMILAIGAAWVWGLVWILLGKPFLPRGNRKVVPWGWVSFGACWVAFFVLQVATLSVYLRNTYGATPPKGPDGRLQLTAMDQMTVSATSNLAILLLIPLILRLLSGASARDIGFTSHEFFKNILRGIVAYPLLAPIVFGAFGVALRIWGKNSHPIEDLIRADRSVHSIIVTVSAGVLMAPLVEELMFRGLSLGLLLNFARKRRGFGDAEILSLGFEDIDLVEPLEEIRFLPETDEPLIGFDTSRADRATEDLENPYRAPLAPIQARTIVPAIPLEELDKTPHRDGIVGFIANVTVSVVFALLHGAQWPAPIPIFFLSMGLGLLYQRTGSLVPSIVLHMTFNGVSTAMMLLVAGSGIPDPLKVEARPTVQAPAKPRAKNAAQDKNQSAPRPAESDESSAPK